MEPNKGQHEEYHLLDDMQYRLVQASSWKRFLNYLIDIVVFYVLFYIILIIIAFINPQVIQALDEHSTTGFTLVEQLMILVIYGTYMSIAESIFKGKSVGKLITGTRAVKQDGSLITVRDAQLRGLCRMVPFNAFSALGNPCYPWHDRWTKTYVIDEKLSNYKLS